MLSRMTVNDVIRVHPDAVELFNRLGVDACCGGDLPLFDALRAAGHDPAEVVREIEQRAAGAT